MFTIDNKITFLLFFSAVANANNMKEMRLRLTTDNLKQCLTDSLEMPIDLLSNQMKRLRLKDRPFVTFQPATEKNINELWQKGLEIEQRLQVITSLTLAWN